MKTPAPARIALAAALAASLSALSARPLDGYASFSALADPGSPPGTTRLLVVAVDAYREAGEAAGAVAGARAFRDALEANYFVDGTTELYGGDATKVAVVAALEGLAAALGPQDSLVVYLAGRGGAEDRAGFGYFLAEDAKVDPAAKEGWIAYQWIAALFERAALRHFFLVADAASSDSWFVPEGLPPPAGASATAEAFRARSRQYLLSSGDPAATSLASRAAAILAEGAGGALDARALAAALGAADSLCLRSGAARGGSLVLVPRGEEARAAFAAELALPSHDPKPSLARTGYIMIAGSENGIVSVDGVALRPVAADDYLQIELSPGPHEVAFSTAETLLKRTVVVKEGEGQEVLFVFDPPARSAASDPAAGDPLAASLPDGAAAVEPAHVSPGGFVSTAAPPATPPAPALSSKPKADGSLPEALRKYSPYAEKLMATLKPGDRVRATKDYGRIAKGTSGTYLGIAKIGYPDCCVKWDGLEGATPMAEALPDAAKIKDRSGIYFVEWDAIEKAPKK